MRKPELKLFRFLNSSHHISLCTPPHCQIPLQPVLYTFFRENCTQPLLQLENEVCQVFWKQTVNLTHQCLRGSYYLATQRINDSGRIWVDSARRSRHGTVEE